MKRLNLLLSSLGSALLLLLVQPLQACGFDAEDYFEAYSFFDPTVSAEESYSPFFFSFHAFYDGAWDADSFRQRDNTREWQRYFGDKVKQADVRKLVYEASPVVLGELKDWAEGKGGPPAGEWADNELAQLWKRKKWSVPICYLEFAKRCEPHATILEDAWSYPERNPAQMGRLIEEGLIKYEATKDPFVRLRYGYQLVRLAHYTQAYQQTVDFFDELVAPLAQKTETQLYYWALGHKAGALARLDQPVEANYLFSRVFEMCPAKRKSAWLSFRIDSDADWETLMQRCADDEERANLILMRGIKPYSQSLQEMEALYALAPSSPKLDLLLVREINKLEQDLLSSGFTFQFPLQVGYPRQEHSRALEDLAQLKAFVQRSRESGGMASPWLWEMAAGYLRFVEGDFKAAANQLSTITLATNQGRQAQLLNLFQWAIQVSQLKSLPTATEERLYKTWQEFDFAPDQHELAQKAEDFLTRRFEQLYREQGELGKAFLTHHDLYDLYYYPEPALLDRLLDWEKERQTRSFTAYETVLLKKLGGINVRENLLEIRATLHLAAGEWAQAAEIYKSLPTTALQQAPDYEVEEDPFMPMLQDCLECFETRGDSYTRLQIAEKMLALTAKASAGDVQAHLDLGTAIYNMSYFGHGWMAAAYFRGYSRYSYYDFSNAKEDWAWQADMDAMVRAEQHYHRAYELATDPETKAEALFMAAKCEQNRFYLDGFNDERHLDQKPAYRTHFNLLVRDHKETQFYETALGVCSWLDMYAWSMDN